MFRACLTQGSRSLPSPSQCTSSFHTSTILNASRKAAARAVKKFNNTRKVERWQKAQASRPSVVLGTRPGDNTTWQNCTLAKITVDEKALLSNADLEPTKIPIGTVHMPKQVGYGVGEAEKQLLFEKLPALSATTDIKISIDTLTTWGTSLMNVGKQERELSTYIQNRERELRKANTFAQLLDLRNANAGGIAYENRRRIIAAFSTPSNPFDTGRSEVQVALLTYQIRNLWNHLTTFKRDVGNRRGLRKLVHQRAKILKYLKRKDQDRYETVLEQLALEPESVEGELVV